MALFLRTATHNVHLAVEATFLKGFARLFGFKALEVRATRRVMGT